MMRSMGLGALANVEVHLLRRQLDQLVAKVGSDGERERSRVALVAAKVDAGANLTRAEVALHLNVSTKKVQRMDAAGGLPRCPGLGTVVRYASRDVLRFAPANGKER